MIFEQEAKVYKNNAIQDAIDEAEASATQYNWHTETDTGAGAGTHITGIPKDDFLEAVSDDQSKGGFNVLINNIGMKIRNGLNAIASYGAYIILGDENGSRTEVHSDEISMVTEDDVVAVSFKSSVQSSEEIVSKPLTNSVSKNTTSSVTLSDLATAVSGSEFSVTYNERYYYNGSTDGAFMSGTVSFKFTKGTSQTKTHTYTENATGTSVTRTVTFVYDGTNSFTITNPSPYFTLDLVNLRYTSQNAPTPETTLNGLVNIGGAEITQPTLDTTTLTPYSSRCSIIDGGILRVGKWRFIQVNIQIEDVSLSANNTWAVLDGLSNDLPVTDGRDTSNNLAKMASLSACAQKNSGDISAYITGVGRIVVTTSDQPLVLNNVVMISGWYIAQ